MFHHFAHLKKFSSFVKVGVKVRRGDIIAEVGNTGTKYAHLHYEVHKEKPLRWTAYNNGWTKEQTLAHYADPNDWISKSENIPARYTSMAGWEFMDVRNRNGDFHPGVDINDGVGNQDLGNPVRSPVDGKIVYIGKLNGGWGNHIFIEQEPEKLNKFDMELSMRLVGKFLLQVEEHGEVWFVHPDGKREYVGGTEQEMVKWLQKVKGEALGVSNFDLNKIPKK